MASDDIYNAVAKTAHTIPGDQNERPVGKHPALGAPFGLSRSLTFQALRLGNAARCPLFKNAQGVAQHSGRDWSVLDWYIALVGEVGETANVMKKVRRGDFKALEDAKPKLAQEFADVMIYFDMFLNALGLSSVMDYADFGALRVASKATTLKVDDAPAQMARAVMFLGGAWSFAANHDTPRMPPMKVYLRAFVLALDAAAAGYGIDLGAAVIETFNRKSLELYLPVFLTVSGCFAAKQPEVTSEKAV